jgi:hypothetical protein
MPTALVTGASRGVGWNFSGEIRNTATLRLARRLKQRGTQVNYFTLNLCPERLVGSLLLYYVAPGSLPQQQKR